MVSKASDYGIPSDVMDGVVAMKEKWDGYVSICDTDSTKGTGATANRNKYLTTYRDEILRIIVLYLKNNDNILPADALTFHIKTSTGKRKRIPAPKSTVIGKVTYKEPLIQYFSFRDSVSGKRARPKGVAFIELRYVVDIVEPTSVDNCGGCAFINNANKKVEFTSADVGKKAFYFGRYVNKNGKLGPWCAMFGATII